MTEPMPLTPKASISRNPKQARRAKVERSETFGTESAMNGVNIADSEIKPKA
jgi:hypothetical protein